MKKGMYKFLVSISCLTLFMSFFIVPVNAEIDIYYPDPNSYSAYDYFFTHGYNHLLLRSSNNVTYNVDLNQNGTNNGTESGQEHTTGTINSNGSGTLGSKYMTCSTNTGTSASQTYSCYFSSSSYSVSNSQSINIGFNENTYTSVNNTINQTIDTDITGKITSSSSDSEYAYLPWLSGTFVHDTDYANNRAINFNSNNKYYLIFFTDVVLAASRRVVDIYYQPNTNFTVNYSWRIKVFPSTIRLHIIEFTYEGSNGNFSIDLPGIDSQSIMPLYFGLYSSMPDDIAILSGLRLPLSELMQNGDDNTYESVNSATIVNSQVSQKIGQFDTIENNSVNDMNSKISNLNLTSDILSNSKFLSSALWVKTQFDRMTVSTPIGSVLSFSLILGMTLIFLGKLK